MANHEQGRIRADGDTGTFEQINRAARVNVDGSVDADMPIYGLEVTKEDRELISRRRRTLRWVFIGVVAGVLLVAGIFVAQLLRGGRTRTRETAAQQTEAASAQTAAPQQEQAPAVAPLTVTPTAEDLQLQASTLSFDGTDLSVPQEQLEVEVLEGRVQVTHWLSEPVYEANPVVEEAALRAAALTNLVSDRMVIGADEEQPSTFASVLWIVRNQDGDSYLAVSFPAGTAPTTGSGLSVLATSPRYRISDGVYYALETEDNVPQSAGDTPVMLNDEYIWSTASISYQ